MGDVHEFVSSFQLCSYCFGIYLFLFPTLLSNVEPDWFLLSIESCDSCSSDLCDCTPCNQSETCKLREITSTSTLKSPNCKCCASSISWTNERPFPKPGETTGTFQVERFFFQLAPTVGHTTNDQHPPVMGHVSDALSVNLGNILQCFGHCQCMERGRAGNTRDRTPHPHPLVQHHGLVGCFSR